MINKDLSEVLRTTKKHLGRLELLGVKTVRDFLLYFPRTYNDTSHYTKISEIRLDEVNTLKGQLTNLFNIRSKTGKKMTRALFTDETGSIEVMWFNQPHLTKMLPRKKDIILSGKAKVFRGKVTLSRPSYDIIK